MAALQNERLPLERIVLVPVNGYANRLQAWASCSILAAHFSVPLDVCWEPESIAPAGPWSLFASPVPGSRFISRQEASAHVGMDIAHVHHYLSLVPEQQLVTLAGHDLGEQHFMADLIPALGHASRPTTLLIVAGGKFNLPGTHDFDGQRRIFYQNIPWAPEILDVVERTKAGRNVSLGLHIRETDRSAAAPTGHSIRVALRSLSVRTGVSDVFLAADTLGARRRWRDEIERLNLRPWSASDPDLNRSSAGAGVDALADWVLLSQTQGVIYSKESSFGEEAVIAGGSSAVSVPLTAPAWIRKYRRTATLARTALTYPQRRMAQGRNPS